MRDYRFLFLSLMIIWGGINVYAQQYQLKGKVIGSTSNNPVEWVNVVLVKNDSIFSGTTTDSLGVFLITAPKGIYTLKLEQFGEIFTDKEVELSNDIDLGVLKIRESVQLKEIVIDVKKPLIQQKVDRTVFNVDNSVMAQGLNAQEILKITPGVIINNDNISLAGKSKVLVLINDKPTYMSGVDLMNYLNTLQSNDISKIEMITTPPAKYEAEGNSGIVNIVLKSKNKEGLNGYLSGTYRQGTYGGYNLFSSLNYQKNNWQTTIRFWNYNMNVKTLEKNKLSGKTFEILSDSERKDIPSGTGAYMQSSYQINKNNTIGIEYIFNKKSYNKNINNTTLYKNTNQSDSILLTSSVHQDKGHQHTLSAFYDLNIDSIGKKMNFNINYYTYSPENNVNFVTKNHQNNDLHKVNNITNLGYKIIESKLDFELPFEDINFETGLKFSNTQNNSDIKYYDLLPTPILVESKTNVFNYNENNYAAYISAHKKLSDRWEVKAGLRYEYTQTKGFTPKNNEENKNNYNKLFPSIYINYITNNGNTFSLSYSKRIDRPYFRALNPFKWYTNPYSYSEGNPLLEPSFIDNLELKYSYRNCMLSLYYSHSENNYGQYELPYKNGMQASTYLNYFNTNKYGIQFSIAKQFTNWWYNSSNINGFYSTSNTFDDFTIGQESFGAYISSNNTFNLNASNTLSFVLNCSISLPYKDGNKEYYSKYNLSSGLRYELLYKKLNFSLMFNDILATGKTKGIVYMKNQTFKFDNYYDSRYLSFNISYLFGNNKVKGSNKEIEFEDKDRAD